MAPPTHVEQSTDEGIDQVDEARFPEPEDRGRATLSPLGRVEYVEDLIRPGRIMVVAAEEGAGKSFAMLELGIRVAVARGSFAGTWPVLQTGPVLYLSEMHADDDYHREAEVLASLGHDRAGLEGCFYRQSLMNATGRCPPLRDPDWRAEATRWLRGRRALLVIVDTATSATQVDPWGKDIQEIYAGLRAMLSEYPELAIVLVIHFKKPTARGERRISDVLGEWGRWCDVVMLMEPEGNVRLRLTIRKRVRQERRLVVTKVAGLLVEPIVRDETKGTKVRKEAVLTAIQARPGMTYVELGACLGVSSDTASRYVRDLGDRVKIVPGAAPSGPGARAHVYPVSASLHVAAGDTRGDLAPIASDGSAPQDVESPHRRSTHLGAATPHAETSHAGPLSRPNSDAERPPCETCGHPRRPVPGRPGRYVCTYPHQAVFAQAQEHGTSLGPHG